MTDRDHFAAAALTGFASQLRYGSVFNLTLTAKQCYELADAMLRERERTNHDAAPAARASVESVAPQPTTRGDSDRTDKAAPRPSEGTGDTPKPISGCVSDRPTPITGPDPDSRVWETHTPATHATHGEGSERRECTEPVAWGVASHFRVLATSISRMDAVDMQSDYAYHTEIVPLYRSPPVTKPMPQEKRAEVCAEPAAYGLMRVGGRWVSILDNAVQAETSRQSFDRMENWVHEVVPLYRKPTLTDAEAETLRELRDEAAQYADEIGLCASEVRGRQRIIDGLLVRLGGER